MVDKTIQIKREIIKMHGGKKLQRIGGSLAVLIPIMWAKANGVEIDGDYYIKTRIMDGSTIILEPLDREALDVMLKGVKDDR